MKGKTLGIVGMGRIGYEVAKRCHLGWDMKILYHNENNNHEESDTKLNASRVSLNDLLADSDFVSVHVPLNSKTKGMFNKEVFKKMKSSAIFINTARGDIHNETDLYEALK
jgi:glyoxylate reductase